MTLLIGGFSAQQYKSYLITAPAEHKKPLNLGRSIAHFHLFSFPTIAILVNRLAYFILHHFKVCPNNAYFFEKFKSYAFTKINTQAEYAAVKEIFTLFQRCPSFDSTQLQAIETQLNKTEELLKEEKKILKKEEEKDLLAVVEETVPLQSRPISLDLNQEKEKSFNVLLGKQTKVSTREVKKPKKEEIVPDEDVFDADVDDQLPPEEEKKFQSPESSINPKITDPDEQLTLYTQAKKDGLAISDEGEYYESDEDVEFGFFDSNCDSNCDSNFDSDEEEFKPQRLEDKFEKLEGLSTTSKDSSFTEGSDIGEQEKKQIQLAEEIDLEHMFDFVIEVNQVM